MRSQLGYTDVLLPNLLSRTFRRQAGGVFGLALSPAQGHTPSHLAQLREKRWPGVFTPSQAVYSGQLSDIVVRPQRHAA